jgi:hypothetical protein
MPGFIAAIKTRSTRLLSGSLALALLALAACNGSAVVTVTATPSSDNFLAYRVALDGVQLQTSNGKKTVKIMPAGTTVDFVNLLNLSEVVGIPTVEKGTYTSAVITLDFSAAQIVYDDGSIDGVALSPVGASGQALGQVSVSVNLDPGSPFRIDAKSAAQLALNFNLAASNLVNLGAKTVTVTPMVAVSALPIDTKQVRIRGPLVAASSTTLGLTTGVMPFDGAVGGTGQLGIATSDVTTYEVNGSATTGTAGLAQVGSLSPGSLIVTYGTLTSTTTTTETQMPVTSLLPVTSTTGTDTTTTTPGTDTTTTPETDTTTDVESTSSRTNVLFSASQVLAGSSVQGSGSDRVSGVVSARSGNTLSVENATLIANDGTNTFIPGSTIITIGANTLITVFGQGTTDVISPLQISAGSTIDAFGTATITGSGSATLDATAGRVRIDISTASGLVNSQGVGVLSLNLTSLGGRSISALDFVGTGANPTQYSVATQALDLTNSVAGAPIIVTGLTNSFGVAPPNFTAATLLDPTTIQAELVVDYGAGSAAPFSQFDTSSMGLDVLNPSIGLRHQIQIGSQIISMKGLSTDPSISPTTSTTAVFSIGHSASSIVESFNTYANFVTQLQTELNGATLVTGITAVGQYTPSTFAFSATSITVFLNN